MYPMRRSDREQGEEFALSLIDHCSHGVMSIHTSEAFPYCLPLSFVRNGNCLYFHCAKAGGRKLDLLHANPNVCITFVGGDEPEFVAPNTYTTYFQSAIVTGTAVEVTDQAVEVTDQAEMIEALRLLCEKLMPEHMSGFSHAIQSTLAATSVWRVDIAEARGKQKKRPANC